MKLHARSVLAWTLVLAALGGVFWSYLAPDLVLELATRVWSCL